MQPFFPAKGFQLKSESPKKPVNNKTLESAYKRIKKRLPSQNDLNSLAKQTDLSQRQIERWWRQRRASEKTSVAAR